MGPGGRWDLSALPSVAAAGVTRMTLLPSQLLQAMDTQPALFTRGAWPGLRVVTVSGEACPAVLARRVNDSFGGRVTLLNTFGSTEVAGDACCAVLCGPGTTPTPATPLLLKTPAPGARRAAIVPRHCDSHGNHDNGAPIGYAIDGCCCLVVQVHYHTFGPAPLSFK